MRTISLLMAGTALLTLPLIAPSTALAAAKHRAKAPAAKSSTAKLEAKIAELEAALLAIRADMAAAKQSEQAQASQTAQTAQATAVVAQQAARTEQRVVMLETKPAPPPPPAPKLPDNGFMMGNTLVSYGGFVKVDLIASKFNRADPVVGDLSRDFYLPGSIPVTGMGERTKTEINAKQTRFWLGTSSNLGGHKVTTRIEGDFQVLPGAGDQRTTNPANWSLRRAYVTVDGWLFGQDWSTFQNINVLPETADYIGPSEGTVFVRQPQVRYSFKNGLSLALENAETTVTPYGGGTRVISGDSTIPDVTGRYDFKLGKAEFALAGLYRQIRYQSGAVNSTVDGWGVSGSGKIPVGSKDDLRLMITHGEGIGRYVGLNLANDAVIDKSNQLKAIPLTAGFMAYRHFWNEQFRSSLIYSVQEIDNDVSLTGTGVSKKTESWHANLVWSPFKGFDVGAEYTDGKRTLESGVNGKLQRVQAFAKYGF